MKTRLVKNLMVPLSDYATVNQDANLLDAVMALEEAQKAFDQSSYRHRAILVQDDGGKVVGKISQMDALKALEPKYGEMLENVSHTGFSADFLKSMLDRYSLWGGSLIDICRKAAGINVKNFMSKPGSGEYISENATIDEAIHYLVMGHHHSLIVVGDKNTITGILRLTDLFEDIFDQMKNVEI